MSDDRFQDRQEHRQKADPFLTFDEYVKRVVEKYGKDSEDFRDLEKLYGIFKMRNAYRRAKGLPVEQPVAAVAKK